MVESNFIYKHMLVKKKRKEQDLFTKLSHFHDNDRQYTKVLNPQKA